jgi:hypothetical protein
VSETDLALALRALGHRLEAEPAPDLAPAVLGRLADVAPAPRRRWRPLVLALAVLLLAAAAASTTSASRRCR